MIKKTIVIIGITFLLFAVVLSGCNEQSEDKESTITSMFIGTWEAGLENGTYIFYADKTVKWIRTIEGEVYTDIFNWEDKDEQLCIIPLSDPNAQRCGSYEFSNSATSFTWTIRDMMTLTFNKVL